MRIMIIHGPNLQLLGHREPEIYGTATLDDINRHLEQLAQQRKVTLVTLQSNSEAEIIETIATYGVLSTPSTKVDGVIINPAAFTHTSVAIRDALAAASVPFIEVHLSNVYARETFRHQSYFSDIALGVITGLGASGYGFALTHLIDHLQDS